MATHFSQNEKCGFRCEKCHYYTERKSDFKKHLQTARHNATKMLQKNSHICECGKHYAHHSSYFRHKKVCPLAHDLESQAMEPQAMEPQAMEPQAMDFQKSLMQKQEEFQQKIIDTLKQVMVNSAKNVHIEKQVNRITTNQINLFLNEKCADAMSIQEFAKQMTFQIEDIMMKKQDALVNVIQSNLDPLAITKRPVHCSNVSRRKWLIKDEHEGWQKDDGHALIKAAEREIWRKWVPLFEEKYPNWLENDRKQDDYVLLASESACMMAPKAEARVLSVVGEKMLLDGEDFEE